MRSRDREDRFANQVRKNDRIRAREVRLIGHDGRQIGVVTRDEALVHARAVGLDLVEISPNAVPPVCRVTDFGKYMYELSKRQKENKSKSAGQSRVKEVKFRVRIDEHDYMTKMRRAEGFLFKGAKVKLVLQFRGREMEHTELGIAIVNRAILGLNHVGTADGTPRVTGRTITMIMTPVAQAKRSLKYNEAVSEHDDDSDDDHDDPDDQDDDHDEKD